jgi:hypothetical protein
MRWDEQAHRVFIWITQATQNRAGREWKYCTKMQIFLSTSRGSFTKLWTFLKFKSSFKNQSYSNRAPLNIMSCADRLSCRACEIKPQVNRTCDMNPCNFVDGEGHQPRKETSRYPYIVPNGEKKNRSSPFWWMVVKGCFDCSKFDWSMWGYLALRYHEGELGGEW